MANKLIIILFVLLTGCTTNQRLKESWKINKKSIDDVVYSNKYADIIVYHQLENFTPQQSINFYIDTSFISSLKEKRFRHIRLCPNEYKFLAQFNRQDMGYANKHRKGSSYKADKDKPLYLKIVGTLDKLTVEQVEEAEAKLQMKGYLEQNHALARIRKINLSCSDYQLKKDLAE